MPGRSGNPMLQVGGEQEAVTEPEPANGVESPQDCRHPLAGCTTAGCDALQVNGILVRMSPLLVLGKELIPMMSVRTAVAVCVAVDELEVRKVVWLVCWFPPRRFRG